MYADVVMEVPKSFFEKIIEAVKAFFERIGEFFANLIEKKK